MDCLTGYFIYVSHACCKYCLTGILYAVYLYRMFDRDAALSVCLGRWIRGLTEIIHGVIHRDVELGVSKGCFQGILESMFDMDN